MSTPIHAQISGTFSTGATVVPVNISLPSGYDYIEIVNVTDWASAAANTNIVMAKGFASLPAGSALTIAKNNGAATIGAQTMINTLGFTFLADSGFQSAGTAVAVTGVSTANPAVVTSASTAVVGDIVRLSTLTGVAGNMYQVCGMDFTVTAVNPGVTQTLGYLNSAAFADAATAGFIRIIPFDSRFYPRRRYITAITAANPAVITLSVTHQYTVGQKVRIVVPAAFGMTQIDGLLATVTAISTVNNTITTDIDASAFTAFAFPTSLVAAAGVSFPMVVPVGEAATSTYANLLDDRTTNVSITGVQVGTGVLVASKNYSYIARKGVAI